MSAFTFRAVLAERSGFSRDRDGGMLRLEIAESDIADMIGVTALNRCELEVTIAVAEAMVQNKTDQEYAPTPLATRRKRQPRWTPAETARVN